MPCSLRIPLCSDGGEADHPTTLYGVEVIKHRSSPNDASVTLSWANDDDEGDVYRAIADIARECGIVLTFPPDWSGLPSVNESSVLSLVGRLFYATEAVRFRNSSGGVDVIRMTGIDTPAHDDVRTFGARVVSLFRDEGPSKLYYGTLVVLRPIDDSTLLRMTLDKRAALKLDIDRQQQATNIQFVCLEEDAVVVRAGIMEAGHPFVYHERSATLPLVSVDVVHSERERIEKLHKVSITPTSQSGHQRYFDVQWNDARGGYAAMAELSRLASIHVPFPPVVEWSVLEPDTQEDALTLVRDFLFAEGVQRKVLPVNDSDSDGAEVLVLNYVESSLTRSQYLFFGNRMLSIVSRSRPQLLHYEEIHLTVSLDTAITILQELRYKISYKCDASKRMISVVALEDSLPGIRTALSAVTSRRTVTQRPAHALTSRNSVVHNFDVIIPVVTLSAAFNSILRSLDTKYRVQISVLSVDPALILVNWKEHMHSLQRALSEVAEHVGLRITLPSGWLQLDAPQLSIAIDLLRRFFFAEHAEHKSGQTVALTGLKAPANFTDLLGSRVVSHCRIDAPSIMHFSEAALTSRVDPDRLTQLLISKAVFDFSHPGVVRFVCFDKHVPLVNNTVLSSDAEHASSSPTTATDAARRKASDEAVRAIKFPVARKYYLTPALSQQIEERHSVILGCDSPDSIVQLAWEDLVCGYMALIELANIAGLCIPHPVDWNTLQPPQHRHALALLRQLLCCDTLRHNASEEWIELGTMRVPPNNLRNVGDTCVAILRQSATLSFREIVTGFASLGEQMLLPLVDGYVAIDVDQPGGVVRYVCLKEIAPSIHNAIVKVLTPLKLPRPSKSPRIFSAQSMSSIEAFEEEATALTMRGKIDAIARDEMCIALKKILDDSVSKRMCGSVVSSLDFAFRLGELGTILHSCTVDNLIFIIVATVSCSKTDTLLTRAAAVLTWIHADPQLSRAILPVMDLSSPNDARGVPRGNSVLNEVLTFFILRAGDGLRLFETARAAASLTCARLPLLSVADFSHAMWFEDTGGVSLQWPALRATLLELLNAP